MTRRRGVPLKASSIPGVAQGPLQPDSPDRRDDQSPGALALATRALVVPLFIAAVMFQVTTFVFHFSGGQTRMATPVAAGPIIAVAVALVVGISTARRTAQYGRVLRMMLWATVLAWLVIVGTEQVLSVTLLCQSTSCGWRPP